MLDYKQYKRIIKINSYIAKLKIVLIVVFVAMIIIAATDV